MTRAKALRKLAELHANLPVLACQQKCASCCESFRIPSLEWSRIEKQVAQLPPVLDRKVCPLLTEGGCSVYDIRPTLCRIWYCVENNPCPHGCKPDRYLTPLQAKAVLEEAVALSRNDFAGPEVEVLKLEQQVRQMFQTEGILWP